MRYQAVNMDNTSHMYFLQIDPVADASIESEAVPFSMIVNKRVDEISIPVSKDYNFIDSTVIDQNQINYINTQKYYNNYSIQTNIDVGLLNNHYENVSQILSIPAESDSNVNVQDKAPIPKSTEEPVKNTVCKRKKGNGIVHLQDRIVPPRALAVLPAALYMRRGFIVPRRALPARVKFGPVQGIRHQTTPETATELLLGAAASKEAIFLIKLNGYVTRIDVSDHDKSNWFSLLPLGDQSTANVWLYREDNELYGITVRAIASRTPLILGYSQQYAEEINLPPGQPVLDIAKELTEYYDRWWCNECERAFNSASLLQHHMEVEHKDVKKRRTRRGRFRCRHCDRTYSRFFTLKRHMSLYCRKRSDNNELNKSNSTTKGDIMTLNMDDSRLPSDESLQNFSSGIDFSTNLFDTDRISNLDISASSKCEMEFNPYSMINKDGIELETYPNDELQSEEIVVECESSNGNNQPMLMSCPHCRQTIVKEKQLQHLSKCQANNYSEDAFSNQEKTDNHDNVQLPVTETIDESAKTKNTKFRCEKCEVTYMRRGMFVNHMWRVHKTSPVTVPLERRVLHYPCVACPKLYRAANKRDRHVKKHHPGVELVKGSSIEGAIKHCEPAVCPACPRQYVTRAKLLQHLRAAHPDVAAPVQKSMKSKVGDENQPNTPVSSVRASSGFNYFV